MLAFSRCSTEEEGVKEEEREEEMMRKDEEGMKGVAGGVGRRCQGIFLG